MKNNNATSFIIIAGIFILCVFTFIATYNVLENHKESNSYYTKVDNIDAKIESLKMKDNQLSIDTSGKSSFYCIKTTISKPDANSLCWKSLDNGKASVSIYSNKEYYLWLKDDKGNISSSTKVRDVLEKK